MGGCSIVGCRNRFARGKLHFYRFPKDERRNAWIQFTRKGNNFQPKNSSTICEVHFAKECFQEKKDRVHLSKDAVPTIFFKQSSLGLEMVQVPYDTINRQYFGQESIELLRGVISAEDEEAISIKKQQKLDELKNLCRFCFCIDPKNESRCVSITKLDSYNINLNDLLTSLGLCLQSNEFYGELVCEQCFQQIVEIDLFKKKCREAQEEVFLEIQELETKLQEVRSKNSGKCWYKTEIGHSQVKEETQLEVTAIEVLEEHLVDDDEFDETNFQYEAELGHQQLEATEEYVEEIHDGYKIIYQQICEPNVSDERIYKQVLVSEIMPDETVEGCQPIELQVNEMQREINILKNKPPDEIVQGVDEYVVESTNDIIKNPDRNRFCFRIYECFFCKMKFAGRKTYIAHKCPVKEVKCDQCDKMFNKIQSYNSHVSHVHGSLPIAKHFCPLCKTVIMATLNQFKQHRRQCNKETKSQPIECEICKKVCNNLKGYTIHKLFHDTRNFTTSTGEKIITEGLNSNKGISICELCGKDFQSTIGYRMHKRNVHRVGQAEGETFHCHVCSKMCPTKRSLFDHMRNTHRVQESCCNICDKVFRTRVLLKKHMMYHDETKRVFKCKLCPDKPGYFTNVALKRHQKSHVGSRDFKCDVPSCESAYTTNHQLKMHKANKHIAEYTETVN